MLLSVIDSPPPRACVPSSRATRAGLGRGVAWETLLARKQKNGSAAGPVGEKCVYARGNRTPWWRMRLTRVLRFVACASEFLRPCGAASPAVVKPVVISVMRRRAPSAADPLAARNSPRGRRGVDVMVIYLRSFERRRCGTDKHEHRIDDHHNINEVSSRFSAHLFYLFFSAFWRAF